MLHVKVEPAIVACLLVQCRNVRVLASELFAPQKWALRLWGWPGVLDKGDFFFAALKVFIVGQGGVVFQVEGGREGGAARPI